MLMAVAWKRLLGEARCVKCGTGAAPILCTPSHHPYRRVRIAYLQYGRHGQPK